MSDDDFPASRRVADKGTADAKFCFGELVDGPSQKGGVDASSVSGFFVGLAVEQVPPDGADQGAVDAEQPDKGL